MTSYGGKWRRLRAAFLQRHPLCAYCGRLGHVKAATVVDHIEAHKGDPAKFWNPANWQPLCKSCHDRTKQAEERGGIDGGCDADGWPVSPAHPWNKARAN